ncbi:DUF305 domain-containing protein [Streptomyces sp. OM5714]|uniref:DUF305 domain-containing protein n=1 Tax=Streptomyces sp. OM5714 TaxID=2602736 RepID=UPI0013DD4363|nr:DUF305 domain-containing protein [Streptomyces sp. OM5714]KAF2780378.1 copper resistance protein [Streptomyces sp. OM5714]
MTSRSSIRIRTRRTALAAATATAAFLLAACGGDGDGGSGHEGPHASASAGAEAGSTAGNETGENAHNAQDVAFAQGMIPHHRQALEMARLAADRSASAEVEDLAARIEKAQDPEITTMTGWLTAWGEEVPESMPGMDHSAHSGMPGMMGAEDMTKLKEASGREFDTMFLTMMVEHHEGAVEMAGTEKAKGRYAPAKTLADAIATAQNAEITEMNKLLGKDGKDGKDDGNGNDGGNGKD